MSVADVLPRDSGDGIHPATTRLSLKSGGGGDVTLVIVMNGPQPRDALVVSMLQGMHLRTYYFGP